MMKTLLLLACAALISGFTVKGKAILGELVDDLNHILNNTTKTTFEGKPIYMLDLTKTDDGLTCGPRYFCRAMEELSKKSKTFLEYKRIKRHLKMYNEHYGKNCEEQQNVDTSVEEELEQIPPDVFFKNLRKCAKHVNSQKS